MGDRLPPLFCKRRAAWLRNRRGEYPALAQTSEVHRSSRVRLRGERSVRATGSASRVHRKPAGIARVSQNPTSRRPSFRWRDEAILARTAAQLPRTAAQSTAHAAASRPTNPSTQPDGQPRSLLLLSIRAYGAALHAADATQWKRRRSSTMEHRRTTPEYRRRRGASSAAAFEHSPRLRS